MAQPNGAVQTNKSVKVKKVKALLEPSLNSEVHDGQNKFARALGSTDYMTREKGLQALQRWMQRQPEIQKEDMMKIWKGLFYCFWMSDKAPVQAELAQRFADLLPSFNTEMGFTYFSAFVGTMRREWFGIDRLRLDKFLLLVRMFLASMFTTMANKKWDLEIVQLYMDFLRSSLLIPEGDSTMKALGLTYHIADIFIPELLKCSVSSKVAVSGEVLDKLMQPLCDALAAADDKAMSSRIREGVFDELLEELRNPSEGEPLKNMDIQGLATMIFDTGARPSTSTKNRTVLYALSELAEKAKKKRMRMEAAATSAAPSFGSGAEMDAKPSEKKKADLDSAFSFEPAQATPSAVELEVAAGPASSSKKKKKKQETEAAVHEIVAAAEVVPHVASEEKAKNKKRKSIQDNTTPLAQISNGEATTSFGSEVVVSEGSGKRGKSSLKKQLLRDEQQQMEVAAEVAAAQMAQEAKSPAKADKSGSKVEKKSAMKSAIKTPVAQKVAAAAAVAAPTTGKKKVKISLKNNLYFAFGGPVPDPDLRTPPPARSKGGILKKSDLPIPIKMPKSAPAKMKQGAKGGDGVKVHMSGGNDTPNANKPQKKVSPKSAPRAKAGLFF